MIKFSQFTREIFYSPTLLNFNLKIIYLKFSNFASEFLPKKIVAMKNKSVNVAVVIFINSQWNYLTQIKFYAKQ